jgi:hypothetical protein
LSYPRPLDKSGTLALNTITRNFTVLGRVAMRAAVFAAGAVLLTAGMVSAEQHIALITGVDADKSTVTYTITVGKNRVSVHGSGCGFFLHRRSV